MCYHCTSLFHLRSVSHGIDLKGQPVRTPCSGGEDRRVAFVVFHDGENGASVCGHQSSQNNCVVGAFVILILWKILGALVTSVQEAPLHPKHDTAFSPAKVRLHIGQNQ